MTTCAYPGCNNDAQYTCVVCRQRFCVDHIYQQGGYVCKTHFNEPTFTDPHAPQSSAQWLYRRFLQNLDFSPLRKSVERWFRANRKS